VILDPRNGAHRGEVLPNIALNLDIAPTVLQIAGIRSPDRYQGISLTPWADIPPRDGFFCEHRMEHKRIPKWEGYRGKRYVYANYFEQESAQEFLHDLESDPDQLKNLVQDPQHAKVLAELQQKTRNLSRRYANAR
jgi:arylsulfatase A-like enzyme